MGAIGFGVEAYRKPEFKLTVTPALATYVQGQTVEATLAGDYFFGAPVSGARVQYTTGQYDQQEFRGVLNVPLMGEKLAAKREGVRIKGLRTPVGLTADHRRPRRSW